MIGLSPILARRSSAAWAVQIVEFGSITDLPSPSMWVITSLASRATFMSGIGREAAIEARTSSLSCSEVMSAFFLLDDLVAIWRRTAPLARVEPGPARRERSERAHGAGAA